MTEQRKPRRRRSHPAAAAGRILAAGISASVTIGLSGVIAQAAREADAAAGKADTVQPPPTSLPRPIIVQLVPQPVSPGLVAPSQSAPPTTLAGSRPLVTASTGPRVSRTTTRATVVALPVRSSASPPTTRPPPVTTSSGSKP